MPYVTMYNDKYHYAAALPSEGEPEQALLLIHGAGGNHKHWEPLLEELGGRHLVIAPDLPGHGLSAGLPADNITAYRVFIEKFSDILLGMPFYMAGHSMGGAIAMDYALHNPGRLAGLILVGTGSRLRVSKELLDTYRNNMLFEGLTGFLFGPGAEAELLDSIGRELAAVPPSTYCNDFSACHGFNIDHSLNAIKVPTLVVSADLDVMTPVKYGERLAGGIPGSVMKVIGGAGHMMMLERPGEVSRAIFEFMAKEYE